MVMQLFLSQSMKELASRLAEEIQEGSLDPLKSRTILIPNAAMKQWLLLELAKKMPVAMGLKFVQIESLFSSAVSPLEMFCLCYQELRCAQDEELKAYLGNSESRLLELASQLSQLFIRYGQYGESLFENLPDNWQGKILKKLFVEGSRRLPVQLDPLSFKEEIICFGVDFLAPVYWNFLSKASHLSVYLFSPCMEFWSDLCSDREKTYLKRYWTKRKASQPALEELNHYLNSGPRWLANWGRAGKQTLLSLDRFDFDVEERYALLEEISALTKLQSRILNFQEEEKLDSDGSIRIFQTGSSRLNEVECLRDEILKLDVAFEEIVVLAADIKLYAPLIEFVFEGLIPFSISGVDVSAKNPFRRALFKWIKLFRGRWDAEDVLALLESEAFYKKRGWDRKQVEQIRKWVEEERVDWGFCKEERQKRLESLFGHRDYEDLGSWEKGLDALVDRLVFFSPLDVDAALLEEVIFTLHKLKQSGFGREKTLSQWADALQMLVDEWLVDDEEEGLGFLIASLRKMESEERFPLSVIERLMRQPHYGNMHANLLHAVRILPFEEGALQEAKAVFLLGMEEESFPQRQTKNSLDLMAGKGLDPSDRDRYLFLQALFSAKNYLRISYGHLSEKEGKPVAASSVVQELMQDLDEKAVVLYEACRYEEPRKTFPWPALEDSPLKAEEMVIQAADLRSLAKNPWKFYLKKACGLYVDEPIGEIFNVQKAMLKYTVFGEKPPLLPLGRIGACLEENASEEIAEYQKQLAAWGASVETLVLKEDRALELEVDGIKVRIVGEVPRASSEGYVYVKDDLKTRLRCRPDALITALFFKKEQMLSLEKGKVVALPNPEENLKKFIRYYLLALKSPSPLLPEWGETILKKEDWSKLTPEDATSEWVFACVENPVLEEWRPILQEVFHETL